jgi:tetratricopeptide (TPR) repeat protein
LSPFAPASAKANQNYGNYHQQVMEAEKLLADEKYPEALKVYESLFSNYDFIFLRDYQIVTQLALHLKNHQKALQYLKEGIKAGWDKKSVKKNGYLAPLWKNRQWKSIRKEYASLRNHYQEKLDKPVRKQVKKMFAKDQWQALGALFKFSPKGQDHYAEKKFGPHSKKQVEQLIIILDGKGYPGERLIGNSFWVATILTHHNSISKAYVQKDTLYEFLKPKLLTAISKGQMSPEEFALIDDWYRVVKFNGKEPAYGYLNALSQSELVQVNAVRKKIGLGTVETRNQLIDIEKRTGMNFYLPGNPWVQGKIMIKEK